MKLSDRALLTQLSISQWSARRFDKQTSRKVANDFGVAEHVGRYNKALLPGADTLALVHAKTTYIRGLYYKNTLPWGLEGTQLLPSDNYLAFVTDFRREKAEWENLVDQFVQDYPYLISKARNQLQGLFNNEDYPHPNLIRDKFNMDMAMFPVPTTDFRVAIGDAELDAIKNDVERRVMTAQVEALKAAWQRLYDRVESVYDKISDPTSIFRDSLIENVRETCELLERLNFAKDPNFEAMRQEVLYRIASHDPDALRRDLDVRSDAASEVKDIMDRMKMFM